MSIEIMNRVWKLSEAKGSKLLLLLAIADYADENGFAWPGIDTLAAKIRMSTQSVRNLTKDLINMGELVKISRADAGRSNLYIVTTNISDKELETAIARASKFGGGKIFLPPNPFEGGGKNFWGGGKTAILGGGKIAVLPDPSTNTSDDPSINHQESAQAETPSEYQPHPVQEEPAPVEEPPGTVEPWRGPPPAAARVYQSRMNRWPRRTQYRRLHEVVGDEPDDLVFWGRVVGEYDALGWNPMNVAGMLEWFGRREIPHVRQKGGGKRNLPDPMNEAWRRRRQGIDDGLPVIDVDYVTL